MPSQLPWVFEIIALFQPSFLVLPITWVKKKHNSWVCVLSVTLAEHNHCGEDGAGPPESDAWLERVLRSVPQHGVREAPGVQGHLRGGLQVSAVGTYQCHWQPDCCLVGAAAFRASLGGEDHLWAGQGAAENMCHRKSPGCCRHPIEGQSHWGLPSVA